MRELAEQIPPSKNKKSACMVRVLASPALTPLKKLLNAGLPGIEICVASRDLREPSVMPKPRCSAFSLQQRGTGATAVPAIAR